MTLCDGVFDPIHVGHIRYLYAALAYGAPLCVRVAPDAAIMAKGRQPFQTQAERLRTINAIGIVDYVRGGPDSLADTVRSMMPKYLVKGIDWKGQLPDDVMAACQDVGTRIVFVDTQERSSRERLGA